MRILIVDDESDIREVIGLLLRGAGYEVLEAANGREAVNAVSGDKSVDLCIMDMMMPELDGVNATAEIRKFSSVPILFLTAKSLEADKEAAYASGGDDYLVKPFSSRELLMKVDALTRRYTSYKNKSESDGELIRLYGGVLLNPETREVTKNGSLVDVRDKEFEVLMYLAKNRGKVVSPRELYSEVWGEIPLPSSSNTVTVHMLNLRRKLEDDPSAPKLVRTVWGKGYKID